MLLSFIHFNFNHLDAFSFLSLVCLALLVIVFGRVKPTNKKPFLVSFWVIVFIGTIVFMWGYNEGPILEANFVMLLLRSVISSFEMFISETHLDEIAIEKPGWLQTDDGKLYLAVFFAVYSFALVISFWAVFSVLGRRWTGYIWRVFHCGKAKKQFIFVGINKPASLVAKSLQEKGDIIFISFPEQNQKRFSFISLFQTNSASFDYMKGIRKANVFPAKRQFFEGEYKKLKNLLSSAGLRWMISRFTSSKTEIFILSDDETANIRNLQALIKAGCTEPSFYCHARREGLVGLISQSFPIGKIHFVDSSYLAVRELLKNDALHPVKYVDVAKDKIGRKLGYINTPFNSMVLGFGQTGQEAVKFLYEFGCFSDSKGNLQSANIYVVDRNVKEMAGQFVHYHSGASFQNDDNKEGRIRFITANVFDHGFNTFLSNAISNISYLVVALGNTQKNLEVGLEVLNYANKYRIQGLNNFVVMIHLPLTNFEKTLEHRLIEAYLNTKEYNDHFKFFGQLESIWQYNNISDSDIDEKAKIFYEQYIKAWGKDIYIDDKNGNSIHVWDKRMEDLDAAIKMQNLKSVEEFHMKIEQDRHNCYHTCTKNELGAQEVSQWEAFIPSEFSGKHYLATPNDDSDYQFHYDLCNYLSITEHLRWQCYNEMMGYVTAPNGERDYLKKWHEYMKPFKDLPESVQHCDWLTVKTVGMLCPNNKEGIPHNEPSELIV